MQSLSHKFLILSCLFALIFLFAACNSGNDKSLAKQASGTLTSSTNGSISLSGAFALYPMSVKWAEKFNEQYPDIKINISAGGAGKGMTDALSGMVDLGMFSKNISDEEKKKGAWWIAVAKDAVLPTISASNPCLAELKARGITKEKFYDIFISQKIKTWGAALGTGKADEIHVYTRADACGAAEMWAKFLKNKKQEDLAGYGINGDPGVADALRKDNLGIGFNNIGYVYDMQTRKKYPGLEVVPIDLNGNGKVDPEENFFDNLDLITKAVKENKYPSPPARDLYYVSKGKPDSFVTRAFLKWILTDGQKYVAEAGYVLLPPEKISEELKKLN